MRFLYSGIQLRWRNVKQGVESGRCHGNLGNRKSRGKLRKCWPRPFHINTASRLPPWNPRPWCSLKPHPGPPLKPRSPSTIHLLSPIVTFSPYLGLMAVEDPFLFVEPLPGRKKFLNVDARATETVASPLLRRRSHARASRWRCIVGVQQTLCPFALRPSASRV